jgi:hypothetical protein
MAFLERSPSGKGTRGFFLDKEAEIDKTNLIRFEGTELRGSGIKLTLKKA